MTLIIIDGKNALYRFGHAMKNLITENNTPTGAVYGFIGMMLRLKKKYQDGQFVIVWDGIGYRAGWRSKLYSEYKSNRAVTGLSADVKAIHSQEAVIKKICNLLGLVQTALDEVEADDIIGVLATQLKEYYETVVVYSTDKDFLQLMKNGVTVIRDVGKQRMTPMTPVDVGELFRCEIKDVLKIRAICGDGSDNIKGAMKGVGGVGAMKMIAAGADPGDPFCKVGHSRWGSEVWERVHTNYRIMRIIQSPDDKELSRSQQVQLEREVTRIEAHLFGKVKLKRTTDDFRALLALLSELELRDAIENRHELWALSKIN